MRDAPIQVEVLAFGKPCDEQGNVLRSGGQLAEHQELGRTEGWPDDDAWSPERFGPEAGTAQSRPLPGQAGVVLRPFVLGGALHPVVTVARTRPESPGGRTYTVARFLTTRAPIASLDGRPCVDPLAYSPLVLSRAALLGSTEGLTVAQATTLAPMELAPCRLPSLSDAEVDFVDEALRFIWAGVPVVVRMDSAVKEERFWTWADHLYLRLSADQRPFFSAGFNVSSAVGDLLLAAASRHPPWAAAFDPHRQCWTPPSATRRGTPFDPTRLEAGAAALASEASPHSSSACRLPKWLPTSEGKPVDFAQSLTRRRFAHPGRVQLELRRVENLKAWLQGERDLPPESISQLRIPASRTAAIESMVAALSSPSTPGQVERAMGLLWELRLTGQTQLLATLLRAGLPRSLTSLMRATDPVRALQAVARLPDALRPHGLPTDARVAQEWLSALLESPPPDLLSSLLTAPSPIALDPWLGRHGLALIGRHCDSTGRILLCEPDLHRILAAHPPEVAEVLAAAFGEGTWQARWADRPLSASTRQAVLQLHERRLFSGPPRTGARQAQAEASWSWIEALAGAPWERRHPISRLVLCPPPGPPTPALAGRLVSWMAEGRVPPTARARAAQWASRHWPVLRDAGSPTRFWSPSWQALFELWPEPRPRIGPTAPRPRPKDALMEAGLSPETTRRLLHRWPQLARHRAAGASHVELDLYPRRRRACALIARGVLGTWLLASGLLLLSPLAWAFGPFFGGGALLLLLGWVALWASPRLDRVLLRFASGRPLPQQAAARVHRLRRGWIELRLSPRLEDALDRVHPSPSQRAP